MQTKTTYHLQKEKEKVTPPYHLTTIMIQKVASISKTKPWRFPCSYLLMGCDRRVQYR